MEKEILELEEALRTAQLAGDTALFERVLSDDFQFITPQGKIISKREDIDQYKSGTLKLSRVDVEDRTIRVYGTAAVVRFKVRFDGQSGKYVFSSNFIFTRIYSKICGAWKMVGGHSSELK